MEKEYDDLDFGRALYDDEHEFARFVDAGHQRDPSRMKIVVKRLMRLPCG